MKLRAFAGDNPNIFGSNVGAEVNDFGAYADMTDTYDANNVMVSYGDGVVDYNDLGAFYDEWLWDANEPKTW